MPVPPAAVTSAATESTVPGRCVVGPRSVEDRADTHTVRPAEPRTTATPRPIPRLAPVTQQRADDRSSSDSSEVRGGDLCGLPGLVDHSEPDVAQRAGQSAA